MESDQPIHAIKVDNLCHSFAWRPNGKQTDDTGVEADRESIDYFILAGWVDQRTYDTVFGSHVFDRKYQKYFLKNQIAMIIFKIIFRKVIF